MKQPQSNAPKATVQGPSRKPLRTRWLEASKLQPQRAVKNFIARCILWRYTAQVEIRNFLERRLERLYTKNERKGFSPDVVEKVTKMFDFLESMQDPEELRALPKWKAHRLSGSKGEVIWGLHVTANWRLTFKVDVATNEIKDVNYEDYRKA